MTFSDEARQVEQLIPGLPDEIAEHCILRLPYPYQSLVRSVSFSWNKALTNTDFLQTKKNLSISLPYIFVFAYQRSSPKIQWQAFDPRSHRWFILPPMPCPKSVRPSSFACVSVPKQGKLYVLGGMRSDTEFPLQSSVAYSTATNEWSLSRPMSAARAYFAAGSIGEKIYVAGGSCTAGLDNIVSSSTAECYDPENDIWKPVARMRSGLARYDSVVIGDKMFVTEGWTWPFSFTPRGWVYDSRKDTWEEMKVGMREGWTGVSFALGERLFVISEHGDCRMKVYNDDVDTWQFVGGTRFPCEETQRPFTVSTVEERIYVVANGLKVVVGSVFEVEKGKLRVEWDKVVEGPKTFWDMVPSNSQVVYG